MMLILKNNPKLLMKLKRTTAIAGLFFLTSNMIVAQKKSVQTKPNVIVILMDDMGYGDLSSYNGSLLYQTPHLDKMATEGMRFTNFYVGQAVCTASRASLLTGCYPNRIGMHGVLMPWDSRALNPKEETIAKLLKNAGYYTGMVGKWHLGTKTPYLPLHYGFNEYLGLPYSNDMWPMDYDGTPITDVNNFRYRFPQLPLLEGDHVVKYIKTMDDQGELTQTYTHRACEFITKNKKRPFFLYLAHSMVHIPLAVSPAFKGKSKEGLFGDVMMEVDWSVGKMMETLKKEGIDKNTLVIFISDNGPWLNFGNHAGNTAGLREGKSTTWEGGQRVPCIMRWPGTIPAGTICNKMAAAIDLLPTLVHIGGATLPSQKIDGVNVMPLLLNEQAANPRDELVYYYQKNNLEALRKGQWKLVFPHQSRTYKNAPPGQDGFPSKFGQVKVPKALYDLRTDPGETLDVQSAHPDVVKELEIIADKYRKDLGDDLTDIPCSECRPSAMITD